MRVRWGCRGSLPRVAELAGRWHPGDVCVGWLRPILPSDCRSVCFDARTQALGFVRGRMEGFPKLLHFVLELLNSSRLRLGLFQDLSYNLRL